MKSLRRSLARLFLYPLAALGAVACLVTFTPLVSWWAGKLAGSWNDPSGETLIVLGGSMAADDILGQNSYLRAQYAVYAYREGWVRHIILSGGNATGPSVAAAMKQVLLSHGIPDSIIELEAAARSTHENAQNVGPLLAGRPGRNVLLTSDYHMYRAFSVFRKAGIDVLPRPFPDVRKRAAGWRGRWPAFIELCDETVKIVYYRYKGWI